MALPANAQPRSVGTFALPDLSLAQAARIGLIDVGRTVVKPGECDERGEFLPRHQFGRYSDGAPWLWNHLGFDRTAMQDRQVFTAVLKVGFNSDVGTRGTLCCLWMAAQMAEKATEIDIFRVFRACGRTIRG